MTKGARHRVLACARTTSVSSIDSAISSRAPLRCRVEGRAIFLLGAEVGTLLLKPGLRPRFWAPLLSS